MQTKINYIEFQVADIARSKKFYGQAFGWTFTDYGPTYCEFSDGNMKGGFEYNDKTKGKIKDKTEETIRGGPLVVLYDDDLEAAMKRVEAAGGKISKAIFDFPGGSRFQFLDQDGYELSVWRQTE